MIVHGPDDAGASSVHQSDHLPEIATVLEPTEDRLAVEAGKRRGEEGNEVPGVDVVTEGGSQLVETRCGSP